jgi:serine/threonine protein kinase
MQASVLNDPNRKIYAIKVIKKDALLKKSAYQQKQLVKEIQIQRELKHCGNTLKLHKIYESDRYLNMLMEF